MPAPVLPAEVAAPYGSESLARVAIYRNGASGLNVPVGVVTADPGIKSALCCAAGYNQLEIVAAVNGVGGVAPFNEVGVIVIHCESDGTEVVEEGLGSLANPGGVTRSQLRKVVQALTYFKLKFYGSGGSADFVGINWVKLTKV